MADYKLWTEVVADLEERGLREEVCDVVRRNHATMFEACGRDRHKTPARARHRAWQALRDNHRMSYPDIARIWGVDHSTVIQALRALRGGQHEDTGDK